MFLRYIFVFSFTTHRLPEMYCEDQDSASYVLSA